MSDVAAGDPNTDYALSVLRHDALRPRLEEVLASHRSDGSLDPASLAGELRPLIEEMLDCTSEEDWAGRRPLSDRRRRGRLGRGYRGAGGDRPPGRGDAAGGMTVTALALLILSVLAVAFAGGLLLRVLGRVAVVLGLLGAAFAGHGALGLLIAAGGALMVALGRSRPLDRRRRHTWPGRGAAGPAARPRRLFGGDLTGRATQS